MSTTEFHKIKHHGLCHLHTVQLITLIGDFKFVEIRLPHLRPCEISGCDTVAWAIIPDQQMTAAHLLLPGVTYGKP